MNLSILNIVAPDRLITSETSGHHHVDDIDDILVQHDDVNNYNAHSHGVTSSRGFPSCAVHARSSCIGAGRPWASMPIRVAHVLHLDRRGRITEGDNRYPLTMQTEEECVSR